MKPVGPVVVSCCACSIGQLGLPASSCWQLEVSESLTAAQSARPHRGAVVDFISAGESKPQPWTSVVTWACNWSPPLSARGPRATAGSRSGITPKLSVAQQRCDKVVTVQRNPHFVHFSLLLGLFFRRSGHPLAIHSRPSTTTRAYRGDYSHVNGPPPPLLPTRYLSLWLSFRCLFPPLGATNRPCGLPLK